MPWIIDGNNVAHGGARAAVRDAALRLARSERLRIVVVFDGAPPPGTPQVERLGAVEVRYARVADSAILAALGPGGRGWRVVSDDRELGRQARELGAEVLSSAEFLARVRKAPPRTSSPAPPVEVEEETAFFADRSHRLGDAPQRVRRRKKA